VAVRGLANLAGMTACVIMADSTEPHSAAILHNVCDCDSRHDCVGVQIRSGFVPTAPVAIDIRDNVVFDLQTNPLLFGAAARNDSPSAILSARLDRLTRWPAESLGAVGVWSALSGEAVRNPQFVNPDGDYNYLPASAERTAGGTPPGSSVGIRYARFDTELFPSFLLDVMTLPVAVANDSLGDADADGVPDDIDGCPGAADSVQGDVDGDGWGDLCDPCSDAEGDGFGSPTLPFSACAGDNCPDHSNPGQADADADGEGDTCDLDDGRIEVTLPDAARVTWQMEHGNQSFNEYRGNLETLQASGEYTQDPAVVPGAVRNCAVPGPAVTDGPDPPPGAVYFHLVTGNRGGVEGDLGVDGLGNPRPNDHPCPITESYRREPGRFRAEGTTIGPSGGNSTEVQEIEG
ncbi:MAG TPA: hypothetical protein VF847_03680, partial [Candidatus Deferrimicrobiaceae bacterium]